MKHKAMLFGCASAAALLILALAAYLVAPISVSEKPITITVNQDNSLGDVVKLLYESRLIRYPWIALFIGRTVYHMETVKGGDYILSQNRGVFAIMKSLAIGAPRHELQVVIPEGWNIHDIGTYFEKKGLFTRQAFEQALRRDWSASYPFLADQPAGTDLEGFLFPDTYRVFADAKPTDVIKKMLDNFESKVNEIYREQAHARGISMRDIVILASIIEREVVGDRDRAKVADIFYRRMKIGMPLQADSTVNYSTGHAFSQASAHDIAIDSPYNTYRNKGLPKGAICNAGISSIKAALYPEPNEYFFFLTTSEQKTIFSKTFEEHIRNKQRYLK